MPGRFLAYLDSIQARDPAVRSRWEILLYPGVWALGLHRVAHALFSARIYLLARLVNHFSRFMTAIDIHPGAKIGRNFFIDHGFVVIGETAEIGDNVTMYQGSTLGGTNPTNGVGGKRQRLQEKVRVVDREGVEDRLRAAGVGEAEAGKLPRHRAGPLIAHVGDASAPRSQGGEVPVELPLIDLAAVVLPLGLLVAQEEVEDMLAQGLGHEL